MVWSDLTDFGHWRENHFQIYPLGQFGQFHSSSHSRPVATTHSIKSARFRIFIILPSCQVDNMFGWTRLFLFAGSFLLSHDTQLKSQSRLASSVILANITTISVIISSLLCMQALVPHTLRPHMSSTPDVFSPLTSCTADVKSHLTPLSKAMIPECSMCALEDSHHSHTIPWRVLKSM